jgi:diguanylate cyclase (GGDEF)-like protein/PAS domain S-box-containing protein
MARAGIKGCSMDERTMTVVVAAVNVLLALALVAQYRNSRSYPGFGWWAVGQSLVAVSFLLNNLRSGSFAGRLAVPVWQVCVIAGFTLVYIGVLRFFGRRERRGPLLALLVFVGCWASLFTFALDRLTLRAVGLYGSAAVLLAAMAIATWRYRLPAVRRSAGFLALVFAATGAIYGSLAMVSALRFGADDQIYTPSLIYSAAYLAVIGGPILWVIGLISMVNERLQAEVVRDAEDMRTVFDTLPDCAILSRLDDGIVVGVNEGFTRITGYQREEALGRSLSDFTKWRDEGDDKALADLLTDAGACENMPTLVRRADGSTVECLLTARTVRLRSELHVISLTRDVTDQRVLEARLVHEATTDPLTDVANHREFLDQIEREFSRSLRTSHPFSVAVLDLDHFKELNDGYGHAAGDAALIDFTTFVHSCIREVDILGRMGGDEFGLLLPHADDHQALDVVDRVRREWVVHTRLATDRPRDTTFSAGIATIRGPSDSVDGLLVRADTALYEAKAAGRNRVVVARADPQQSILDPRAEGPE